MIRSDDLCAFLLFLCPCSAVLDHQEKTQQTGELEYRFEPSALGPAQGEAGMAAVRVERRWFSWGKQDEEQFRC